MEVTLGHIEVKLRSHLNNNLSYAFCPMHTHMTVKSIAGYLNFTSEITRGYWWIHCGQIEVAP